MIIQGNELIAEENKILTNGEAYGHHIYLGINDSPSNWHEISEEEVEQDEQPLEDNLPFGFGL